MALAQRERFAAARAALFDMPLDLALFHFRLFFLQHIDHADAAAGKWPALHPWKAHRWNANLFAFDLPAALLFFGGNFFRRADLGALGASALAIGKVLGRCALDRDARGDRRPKGKHDSNDSHRVTRSSNGSRDFASAQLGGDATPARRSVLPSRGWGAAWGLAC